MEVYKTKFPLLKGQFTQAIFDCDFLLMYVSINYDANEYFQHKCTEPSQMISTRVFMINGIANCIFIRSDGAIQ